MFILGCSRCSLIFFRKIKSSKTGAGSRVLVHGPAPRNSEGAGRWVIEGHCSMPGGDMLVRVAWWPSSQGTERAHQPFLAGSRGLCPQPCPASPAPPWAFVFLLFPLGHSPLKIISSPGEALYCAELHSAPSAPEVTPFCIITPPSLGTSPTPITPTLPGDPPLPSPPPPPGDFLPHHPTLPGDLPSPITPPSLGPPPPPSPHSLPLGTSPPSITPTLPGDLPPSPLPGDLPSPSPTLLLLQVHPALVLLFPSREWQREGLLENRKEKNIRCRFLTSVQHG